MRVLQRPVSDRHLDASLALAAVREQFPALECTRAEFLGAGWGTDVYQLDDRYTARFPRTAAEARETDFDEAVLNLVGSNLSSAFRVPVVVGRGQPGAYFPYEFLVCRLVPGLTAGNPSAPLAEDLTADLGRALTRIHTIDVDEARKAGLREVEWDDSGYSGPLHFIHGDFRDGNIIVDPSSGRLVGIIDWGNAAVGDRVLDFMNLALWRGRDFMHRVLSAYELPIDDAFLQRVEYHVRTQSLQASIEKL